MSLWNLARKNTSRIREKHLLLYEILFSFGWDVNSLISFFSPGFLSESLAVCQNINGAAWHTVPLSTRQVALTGTWAPQGTLRKDLGCAGLVMQHCLTDSSRWTKNNLNTPLPSQDKDLSLGGDAVSLMRSEHSCGRWLGTVGISLFPCSHVKERREYSSSPLFIVVF